MAQALDGPTVRRWCAAALAELDRRREEIDALNVFPVPDGDTGSNLALTMRAVCDAVGAAGEGDLAATVQLMARGALLGARGNSGVIVSQLLRGIAEVLAAAEPAAGVALAHALHRAADLAYAAVADPLEGTVLSVARAAAEAAARAGGELAEVAAAAAAGAREALARTPEQLEPLARAGVVDAGGSGLVVILDTLAAVLGAPAPAPPPVVARPAAALAAARETGSAAYGYEVQYLLDADDGRIPPLRERLARLGDSLVVVGGEGLWNVHVHVNDVGAAIEAGVEAGRPHRIGVTRFADTAPPPPPAPGAAAVAVVAVVPGAGLARLLREAGVVVVAGGESACPSAGQLLDALQGAGVARAVVLPNDPNVAAVAAVAAGLARERGLTVAVVPTRSPVQGLAAVAVHDPDRAFDDDVIAMAAAAGATRYAALTVAARDAHTSVGVCRAGDVLGLVGDDVAVIGPAVGEVARGVLDRMLIAGGELVTLVAGADAEPGLVAGLAEYLHAVRPGVEVSCYDGGQPHYPLLVGVE